MTTSNRAAAFILTAVALGGCAASAAGGAQVRAHPTALAFQGDVARHGAVSRRAKRSGGKESPRARACTSGSSKTCNELGDALSVKHAHTEARHWYVTSCERVRGAMVPNATRLLEVSQEIVRLSRADSRGEDGAAGPQRRLAELRDEATELKSRIHGCLDAGDTLAADDEPMQSLKYYDAVCEFSTLVETVAEAVPSLQQVTESGCTAGARARAELGTGAPFSPRLFAELGQEPKLAEAKQSKSKSEEGMVFSEGDL